MILRPASQRPPLPADPRPEPGARPHPAGHEPAHHRPPRPRVRPPRPEGAGRHPAGVPTRHPVVIYPASGTGAWEAALVNTLSAPGDAVLMVETGQFAVAVEEAERIGLERPSSSRPGTDAATGLPWSLAQGRAGRDDRAAPARRWRPRDQGGVRGAQRNLHRRHQRHRRRCAAPSTRRSTRRC